MRSHLSVDSTATKSNGLRLQSTVRTSTALNQEVLSRYTLRICLFADWQIGRQFATQRKFNTVDVDARSIHLHCGRPRTKINQVLASTDAGLNNCMPLRSCFLFYNLEMARSIAEFVFSIFVFCPGFGGCATILFRVAFALLVKIF
jgi:hypothetical protein